MVIFTHFKRKNLKIFAKELIKLNEEYKNRNFGFDTKLKYFFTEIQAFFKQIGDSKNETLISQLTIYYDTALKGIDPIRLEKLKSERRVNTWIAAFHCLSSINELIQKELESVEKSLKEANEMLSQIVLSALQNQLLTQVLIDQADDLSKVEILWNKLKQNQQISLVDRKLRLSITNNDIYILIDEIFSTIK